MRNLLTLPFLLLILFFHDLYAQDAPIHPSIIGSGVFHGETPALRDLPHLTAEEFQLHVEKARKKLLNPKLKTRNYPFAGQAMPKGPDEAWQKQMGEASVPKAPIANFAGQTSPYFPSDCNGTAGPNHYMQTINCVYAIYNKSGTLLAGPTNMNTLFSGVTGSTYNDGDPLVLYDEMAGRWLAVEFSISGSNDYMLVAVSTTNDPTGTWYKYSFDVADMPDYEKFGIWQDGYYMGTNNTSGNDIYVFQRSVMLSGGTNPLMIGFNNAWRPTTIDGFMCVPPLDNDGQAAPAGSPGIFITINDDAIAGGSDQLWIMELMANWSNPASSTFTRVQQINVTPFDSNFGTTWNNITQPVTTQKLDAIPQVIMNVPQYRNFGSYQTIVCCHTVDVDATNHAGIRWYELRRGTQTSGNWAVRQQGTYAPDAHSRWMGSIMLNGSGQIGLGYNISSASVYPGIRYTGQTSGAYNSATGIMDVPEEIIHTATTYQTGTNRWGDYAQMSVDPADDKTFWFTTQYGGSRQTKIASFKFGASPAVITLPATNVAAASATLNGNLNPNGLATTYYFEYGTSTNYGQSTPVIQAGNGTVMMAVNAGITGLQAGTTYHFRLVGSNNDGTVYGADLTFSFGAVTVTTTEASSVTATSATAGGEVVSDGGLPVTERGICWSISANPTISGNHTSDGSGTGAFISTITGLSANTTYHIRAYATNASGTYYGNDLTFTTSCGIITSFPWNEGFENNGQIPNCWSQEQVNSSGVNWVFITGNGGTNPPNAHTGTYNACLSDGSTADNKTRLITPRLDLSSTSAPVLTFWHTQAVGSTSIRQDQLFVYYKTSLNGAWTLLASYTNSITSWTQRTLTLPNPTDDYYINFEGNAKRGRGVCIDDVSITSSIPILTVTPPSLNVSHSGGTANFTVTSNTIWTAQCDQTWCTVTSSGSGNGTLQAIYTQNESTESRIAQITVTVTGLPPVTVILTQTGIPPTLSVTPAGYMVNYSAGNVYFHVTTNTDWTAQSNESWCTVTAAGNGIGNINTYFQSNPLITERTAEISISVAGLSPVMVSVTQAGRPCLEPAAFAGFDGEICSGTPFELNQALALNYASVYWSTSGDGYFDDPGTVNPYYFHGSNDAGNAIELILHLIPADNCAGAVSDTLTLIIEQSPEVFAGDDLQLPANELVQLNGQAEGYGSLYWASSGDGVFDDPHILNPVYTPGIQDLVNDAVTLTLVGFANAPCNQDISDDMLITFTREQSINLPAGWSGFSSYIIPANSEFAQLMAPLGDTLVIARTFDKLYWPEYGINTIVEFDNHQGYIVKLNEPVTLHISGVRTKNKEFTLQQGWNILPVLSDQQLSTDLITTQLTDNLIIITEIAGNNIYWPAAGINSLDYLIPGKAYLIMVAGNCAITFP